MPKDLHLFKYDRLQDQTIVSGILYRGDPKNKYSEENIPIFDDFRSTWPE